MEILKGENIKFISVDYNRTVPNNLTDKIVIVDDSNNIKWKISSKILGSAIKGKIPEDSKLYFTKNSQFPRFKLTETNFKRKLKLDAADYVVVKDGMFDMDEFHDCTIFKCDEGIYILKNTENAYSVSRSIEDSVRCGWYSTAAKTAYKDVHTKGLSQIFKNLGITVTNLTILKSNVYVSVANSSDFLIKVVENTFNKPIITDESLDSQINGTLEVLDEDTINTLYDMLTSSDFSNRSIGLKLLCGFNVTETPLTVRLLLSLRNSTPFSCNEFNSVGVKQVRESVNHRSLWNTSIGRQDRGFIEAGTHWWNFILRTEDKQYNELDLKLSRILIKKELDRYIKSYLSPEKLLGPSMASMYNFKIDFNVE